MPDGPDFKTLLSSQLILMLRNTNVAGILAFDCPRKCKPVCPQKKLSELMKKSQFYGGREILLVVSMDSL